MKKVRKALLVRSKLTFGNIFLQVATEEDVIRVKENREDLRKTEVELKKWQGLEEDFWDKSQS